MTFDLDNDVHCYYSCSSWALLLLWDNMDCDDVMICVECFDYDYDDVIYDDLLHVRDDYDDDDDHCC